MHVWRVPLDFNWFVQLISAFLLAVFAIIYLVKSTASRYLEVCASLDAGSNGSAKDNNSSKKMPGIGRIEGTCVVCGNAARNRCSGCKAVRYCSHGCQAEHWGSGHKAKCKEYQSHANGHVNEYTTAIHRRRIIGTGGVALVPGDRSSIMSHRSKQVLFPYDVFMELFFWDKLHFTPCGLLNCGNSCFANVVLQCLVFTRPLAAYLLEKSHARECRQNDWCFLCELEMHVEKVIERTHPFSPISILSQLPNIGGNLGYGEQEDAHEFMRLAIDTMQSVCLEEFGGEKAVHPNSHETTIIQHIFGGHLQSQIICSRCNKISSQLENMMDLTVEINGDAASLEECLEQFTACECLHGENMYKCEGCNDYVKASKRLTVHQAPNILTVALKRFQTGRFGKLNKRVSFPETLDLNPYMSEGHDTGNLYNLYAVVVHVDMLNASFFGHYICYVKDLIGDWYRVDDDKVREVELEELLSQSAYMLLYRRVCPRASCLSYIESSRKDSSEPCIPDSIPADPELSGKEKILDSSSIPANPEISRNERFLDFSTISSDESSITDIVLAAPISSELSRNILPDVVAEDDASIVVAPSDASLDGDVSMTDISSPKPKLKPPFSPGFLLKEKSLGQNWDALLGQGQIDGCDSTERLGETQMDGCDSMKNRGEDNGGDTESVDVCGEERDVFVGDSDFGSLCLRGGGDGIKLARQSSSVGG